MLAPPILKGGWPMLSKTSLYECCKHLNQSAEGAHVCLRKQLQLEQTYRHTQSALVWSFAFIALAPVASIGNRASLVCGVQAIIHFLPLQPINFSDHQEKNYPKKHYR